jgi:hypothetical protein
MSVWVQVTSITNWWALTSVKLSREEGRLHVICTSSDSFFQKWIEDQGMTCKL